MAKFHIYNIQLLPNDKDIDEVGAIGYRKLFSKLRDLNKTHLKNSTYESFHHLSNGRFYGPYEFKFSAGRVYGNFIRYAPADSVFNLRTRKVIYSKARDAAAAQRAILIPFVWDTHRHLLAIDSAMLPKPSVVEEMLNKFLAGVAAENFPDHELTINLISSRSKLEQVFEHAVAYSRVSATLHSQNGEAEGLLRELQANHVGNLRVDASPGTNGKMTGVPDFLKRILRATQTHGKAIITYFVHSDGAGTALERRTFDSVAEPASFTLRQSKNDVDGEKLFDRAAQKLSELDVTEDEDPEMDDGE